MERALTGVFHRVTLIPMIFFRRLEQLASSDDVLAILERDCYIFLNSALTLPFSRIVPVISN